MKLEISEIGNVSASKDTMNNLMLALMEAKDFMDVMRVDCTSKGDGIGAKAFSRRMEKYEEAINQIYNALQDKGYYVSYRKGDC